MTLEREAWIVVDLGFGDAGKGSTTDFLVRDRRATLVVRFNGGAQAGHNVVTDDGRHHTFSQFCAGTFVPGVEGLLGPDFLLHPLGMVVEEEHLQRLGIRDAWERTSIDRRARVITPYQQAAGRIRELLRGSGAHGTCGVGIGECARDSLDATEDTLRAGELADPGRTRKKLESQRHRKRAEIAALPGTWTAAATQEAALFDDEGLVDRVLDAWREFSSNSRIVPDSRTHELITEHPRVVFEGAQGLLLDENWGFHPHTTWSDCSPAGALALVPDDRSTTVLGITRAYAVRHGPGPFPTADDQHTFVEEHNDDQCWQGQFRTGPLDGVLLRYACEVMGQLDGIAITCLDRVAEPATVCSGYRADASDTLVRRSDDGLIRSLVPGDRTDLEHRSNLTRLLQRSSPVLDEVGSVLSFVEEVTGRPVLLRSRGPGAGARTWVPATPLPGLAASELGERRGGRRNGQGSDEAEEDQEERQDS